MACKLLESFKLAERYGVLMNGFRATSSETSDNIPTCSILGVKIAAINMEWLLKLLQENQKSLIGKYICVSNVHTTVFSYDNSYYKDIQNNAFLALPDGKPLSSICRRRGYAEADRVAGPDLMTEIFRISNDNGYRHFFYGSTQETLDKLKFNLKTNYPRIQIVGMFSPPFGEVSQDDDERIVNLINEVKPDFVWVGLGAPKQEVWMAKHEGRIDGLMIGVGAGFDYHAGNIKRAPKWMQRYSLEWLYRLLQEPKRLFIRYVTTNFKFIRLVIKENKSYSPKRSAY